MLGRILGFFCDWWFLVSVFVLLTGAMLGFFRYELPDTLYQLVVAVLIVTFVITVLFAFICRD